MSKEPTWSFNGAVMLKPWTRPVWPISRFELVLIVVFLSWAGINTYYAPAFGELLLLFYVPAALALGYELDEPWYYPRGPARHLPSLFLFSLVYLVLFPWYALGYLSERYADKRDMDSHWFRLNGAGAHWLVFGMQLPKPWRRPDHEITVRQRGLAVAGFALAPLYVIMVLLTFAAAIYVLATGKMGGLAVAVVVWYAAILMEALGIWHKLLQGIYQEATRDSGRREKILAWLACWLLLVFVYLPFDFLTWERWRRNWNF